MGHSPSGSSFVPYGEQKRPPQAASDRRQNAFLPRRRRKILLNLGLLNLGKAVPVMDENDACADKLRPLQAALWGRIRHVADIADRLDQRSALAQLLAQRAHMHVNCPGFALKA